MAESNVKEFSTENNEIGDVVNKSLEGSIEDISIVEAEQSSSGLQKQEIEEESNPIPRIIKAPKYTCQERYDIFCKDVRIADCKPSEVLNQVHLYIEDNLMGKKWFAMWRSNYDNSFQHNVDVLVTVDDVMTDQAHVALVEPIMCNNPGIPQIVFQKQLEEMDNSLDVVDLFPVVWDDESQEVAPGSFDEEKKIAVVLDNARFFFENIRRDWDDEDEGSQAFDSYLRARLSLHYDIIQGNIPMPLVTRFNRTMTKYIIRRKELLDYQARIQSEGEPTNAEAVECWRKYYEVLMLSGLLQISETLQLKAEGPCYPRVLRRTKGKRKDGAVVTHIVAENLTLSMLKDFTGDDTVIRQHSEPLTALQQCYEGDTVLIYPGMYTGEGFHELTEGITIKGVGSKKDVIIEAVPCDDLFVNISDAKVTLENLTLVQVENTEGILRVESGHALLENCLLTCDGTGVTVREGAQLTMRNCVLTGSKGSGVELMPGCTALLEGNSIETLSFDIFDTDVTEGRAIPSKGGVHLHVVDPPVVKMLDNKIKCEGGYGVTVGRKKYSKLSHFEKKVPKNEDSSVGDAPIALDSLKGLNSDVMSKLNLEMNNNVIEDLTTSVGAMSC